MALEGDLVYVHFDCRDESGEVSHQNPPCCHCGAGSVKGPVSTLHRSLHWSLQILESTRGDADPISFEVGAGDLFQNEMIQVGGAHLFCATANLLNR